MLVHRLCLAEISIEQPEISGGLKGCGVIGYIYPATCRPNVHGVGEAPLVDPGPIACNRARRAAALLLCNRTLRGGRPPPNGTLLVHTPTYSSVVGIFQLPQPVATTDTPPEKNASRP